MANYKYKPRVIEAVQWNGANQSEVHKFTGFEYHTIRADGVLVLHGRSWHASVLVEKTQFVVRSSCGFGFDVFSEANFTEMFETIER